jgi:hypothetical protein
MQRTQFGWVKPPDFWCFVLEVLGISPSPRTAGTKPNQKHHTKCHAVAEWISRALVLLLALVLEGANRFLMQYRQAKLKKPRSPPRATLLTSTDPSLVPLPRHRAPSLCRAAVFPAGHISTKTFVQNSKSTWLHLVKSLASPGVPSFKMQLLTTTTP